MSASKDRKIVEMHAKIDALRQDLAEARALLLDLRHKWLAENYEMYQDIKARIDAALAATADDTPARQERGTG